MLKYILTTLLLCTLVSALEVEINSDNLDEVSNILSSQKNIQKLIRENRVDYSDVTIGETDNFNNNSNRSSVQKNYAKLKKLMVYLDKGVKREELKESLRTAFFKQNAHKKEEFSFIYKISYPSSNGIKGDDVFESLQKEISLYILDKYGISNIEDSRILKNLNVSFYTKNYTVGTTESNFQNNFDNSYREQTILNKDNY